MERLSYRNWETPKRSSHPERLAAYAQVLCLATPLFGQEQPGLHYLTGFDVEWMLKRFAPLFDKLTPWTGKKQGATYRA
jgi:hypothetical protein